MDRVDTFPAVTPGKTVFFQSSDCPTGLFRVMPGIPCEHARQQASELLDCSQELTLSGLMDERPRLIWAAYYLNAFAKTLLDDAELGLERVQQPNG